MNMFEELRAWADKWNVPYKVLEDDYLGEIYFEAASPADPMLSYNKKTGDYSWYGGE